MEHQRVTLFTHQQEVVQQALAQPNRAILLPMGFGKTLIGLALALNQQEKYHTPSLIVCSKTLLASWITEIDKFFGRSIKYEVCHQEHLGRGYHSWTPRPATQLVLTTPEVISSSYQLGAVEQRFILTGEDLRVLYYQVTNHPWSTLSRGPGCLHARRWASLLIDEAQNYNNCETKRCQALASLCANQRWLLSGTLFQEPPVRRLLGFFLLLNAHEPRSLQDCSSFIKNQTFTGFKAYCIERKDNPLFKGVTCRTKIVSHDMTLEEKGCYSLLVHIMRDLCRQYELAKGVDQEQGRRVRGSILAMWTYLRQSLTSPLLPISQMLARLRDDSADPEREASCIGNACKRAFKDHHLDEWLESEEAGKSSRMKQIESLVQQHKKDKILVFGSFVTCLKLVKEFVTDQIQTYILHGEMTSSQRQKVLHDFEQSDTGGVLFLTYQIGSEGLNLQFANVVIHLDLYWNSGKEDQAVARVFRYGQLHPVVYQYIIISPTYLEKVMLEKQKGKSDIIQQLHEGPMISMPKIATLSIKDMQQIVDGEDVSSLARLYRGRSDHLVHLVHPIDDQFPTDDE